jgi:hypothetical protein
MNWRKRKMPLKTIRLLRVEYDGIMPNIYLEINDQEHGFGPAWNADEDQWYWEDLKKGEFVWEYDTLTEINDWIKKNTMLTVTMLAAL